jgi:hypothetical protein
MAINAINFVAKVADKFICECCDYTCCKQSDINKHITTAKHEKKAKCYKNGDNAINFSPKLAKPLMCLCGKEYKHYASLYRHKMKCVSYNDNFEKTFQEKELIQELIKQNKEFKDIIMEQNQKMMDLAVKATTNTNNITNTHTNSHNKNTFNLQFFLNETCKDAMNINDFIESVQLQLKDLEYTGENGYVAGITNVLLRELKQLDICKRPIHCSDVKREVFHIKNEDKLEKESEHLINAIKQTTRKSIILLAEWREKHPGCMEYQNKKNEQYLKINGEVLGAINDVEEEKDFNKIISSVAKATTIDKVEK